MAPRWTDAEWQAVKQEIADGKDAEVIAAETGRSRSSIYNKLKREGVELPQGHHQPAQQSSGRAESVPAQVIQEFKEAAHVPPVVESDWVDEYDAETEWERAAAKNERHIAKAVKRSRFSANLGNDPIAIAFTSDQHISIDNSVDLRRMKQDAEVIRDTPRMYACLVGDGCDNHILIRSAMLAARSQPEDQYRLFEYYLGIMRDSILMLCSGNHTAWTVQAAGIDMVGWLAKEAKLAYCPAEAFCDIRLGSQSYTVAIRHQYKMNSSLNQGHSVKQWFRHGERPFDVGCIAHHHEPHIESGMMHGQQRWFLRPGSYQISSAYSRQYGFNATRPTCPTVVFYPDERRMVGFYDLREAAHWLRMELGR